MTPNRALLPLGDEFPEPGESWHLPHMTGQPRRPTPHALQARVDMLQRELREAYRLWSEDRRTIDNLRAQIARLTATETP